MSVQRVMAVLCLLLVSPLAVGWLRGDFVIFWTQQGAALFQGVAMAAVLEWAGSVDADESKPRTPWGTIAGSIAGVAGIATIIILIFGQGATP